MRSFRSQLTRLLLVMAFLGLSIVGSIQVSAAAAKPVKVPNITNAVTQSYNADAAVEIGMIVRLKEKDPTTVVPLDKDHIQDLFGIVVPQTRATIVLAPAIAKEQQVLVTTSGRSNVLVSDENGPIKVGNYLTLSAISGLAMKADETQASVIGKAAGNFTGSANVIGSVDLKDELGHKKAVAIGIVPLDIAISHNPLFQKSTDRVPSFLNKVATGVSNKPVSVARIYLSFTIFIITAIIASMVLISGVRSGMIAVGRNPLSKKSIIRSLIQTVVAGLIIFLAGVFAVYLLLKL